MPLQFGGLCTFGTSHQTSHSKQPLCRQYWESSRTIDPPPSHFVTSLDGELCSQLDGQITHVVGEMQKVESKLAQLKETSERQKVDIRSLQRDQQANSRTLEPKVTSYSSNSS